MFKKAVFILAIMLITLTSAFALEVEGKGRAVIEKENLKNANDRALSSALINALHSYFTMLNKNTSENRLPEITEEFFKFIKKYKINSRSVNDYVVKYNITADIDDIAINDITYYVSDYKNSSVFTVHGINPEAEVYDSVISSLSSNLIDHSFSTDKNVRFNENLPVNPTIGNILTAFAESPAQYLFNFHIDTSSEQEGELEVCRLELRTKIYSRSKEFNSIMTVSKSINEDYDKCTMDALDSASKKTLNYVRQNLLKLPEKSVSKKTYTLKAVNFGKFIRVKSFIDQLKNKKVISDYRIASYSIGEVSLEIESLFDKLALTAKIKNLEDKYQFRTVPAEGDIVLDFTYTAEQ